jgi:hypothetical protein
MTLLAWLIGLALPATLVAASGAQCLPQCPEETTGVCQDFSQADLGSDWITVHGQPESGEPGCRARLLCSESGKSEIQSVGEMTFGTLQMTGVYHTAWDQAPTTAIDSYIGWQIFVGDCHSAIVLDDGTLAVLFEDPAGDCSADPTLQCYLPIPNWASLASSPRTYELQWTAEKVVLSIDGVERVTASEATCGFSPPALPMKVDLSCNLDGAFAGDHVLEVDALAVYDCVPGATALCLNDGRFRVEADWRTDQNQSAPGMAVPLSRDTGYFWFFDDDNVEEVVKVLDGCTLNDRFWAFAGGLTNVEVETRVTDTLTGKTRTYHNTRGEPFQPLQDTGALESCPPLAGPYRAVFDVPARPEDSKTEILTPTFFLRTGQTVTVSATGTWNVGSGSTGPDGDPAGTCAGCPVPAGLGALIGRTASGSPFLVGSRESFVADRDGALFLGSNDNAVGTCNGFPGSCYDDNQGSLRVTLTVEP